MSEINNLIEIMRKLREPETGCPWDRAQSYASIVPYTIEEAYEVADAIEREDLTDLKDELGDLLFQVVFYAQIAREQGIFDFEDVVQAICAKMIRRHPHVFADQIYANEEQQHQAWEQIKAAERQGTESALDHVALTLPALTRAIKLQKKAARSGFDWTEPEPVIAKIREELAELQEAMKLAENKEKVQEEYGDLLFACANLARFLELDPETALRTANTKFERRFRAMEKLATQTGQVFNNLTLTEQENLWAMVKRAEVERQRKV